MIYRNVTKFIAATFVAAYLIGGGGSSVVAQQSYGVGCTSCASCSQAISFPSSNISSVPQMASQVTYPAGQVYSSPVVQPLPVTSSSVGFPVQDTVVYPTVPSNDFALTVPNAVYANQVNESYQTYPTATYTTGNQIVSSGANYQPVGTFTSMPVTSYSSAPSTVYSQPTTVGTQPVYYPNASTSVRTYQTAPTPVQTFSSYRPASNSAGTVSSGLAQMKAQQAANGRVRGHIGGGLGGARYEGVGWSNQSPQQAIQQCCYWGTRPTAQIGVSRGADGLWYACVLYH